MDFIMSAMLTLGIIAIVAAVILYLCAKRFSVEEDPRISKVTELLPQANCGGCGFPGCSGMAEALVRATDSGSIEGLSCPVGGTETMTKVGVLLGTVMEECEEKVAVVRCGGTCEMRPKIAKYDGLSTCTAMNAVGTGESACGYGCLGGGDCAKACNFGGVRINAETGLPEIDTDLCIGCGMCVNACPRNVLELRSKGKVVKGASRRVWIACKNQDKGAIAKKACTAACIGCGKCAKACRFDAITVSDNVAYIDYKKCKACGLCARECPTGAIHTTFAVPEHKQEPSLVCEEAYSV